MTTTKHPQEAREGGENKTKSAEVLGTCNTCNGNGALGWGPDDYFNWPECSTQEPKTQGVREFLQQLANCEGGMVNGNQLARRAKELLGNAKCVLRGSEGFPLCGDSCARLGYCNGVRNGEPVAKVVENDMDISVIDAVLPLGTKLYTTPAAQAVPGDEVRDPEGVREFLQRCIRFEGKQVSGNDLSRSAQRLLDALRATKTKGEEQQ